jgi:hypothetical protein
MWFQLKDDADKSAANAAQLSINTARTDYLVSEHEFPARATGVRSSDFHVYAARSQRLG